MGNFKTNQSIAEILQSSDVLCRFTQQLQTIENLNQMVKQCLPEPLNEHCWVANIKNNILTLATTSPSWKHQLHYQKTELLSKLRNLDDWRGISSIHLIVQPESLPPPPILKTIPPKLNDANRETILTIAEMIDNSRLKNALKRLANAKVPSSTR